MELIFSNGNVILNKHIPMEEKNLRKVRLSRDGVSEGVWVVFSEEDVKKYDDDTLYGEYIIGALCNDVLCGVPWGSYLKVELVGRDRPLASCEEIFGDKPSFIIADWAAASSCDWALRALKSGEYKLDDDGVREYLILILKTAPESDVTAALKSLLEQ